MKKEKLIPGVGLAPLGDVQGYALDLEPIRPVNEGDPMNNPQLTGQPRHEPLPFIPPDFRLPGGGKMLVVCDDDRDVDAMRRSFRMHGMPVDACVFGARLPEGSRYGLILIAKRPPTDLAEEWISVVVAPCLARGGTLRRIHQ